MATFRNTTRSNTLTTSIGGTPVSGDTVLLVEGKDEYNAGVAHPTVDLAKFHVTKGCAADFLAALDIQAALMILEGKGRIMRLQSNAGAGTFDELRLNAPNLTLDLASSITTLLLVTAGSLLAADSATITTLRQYGGQAYLDQGGAAASEISIDGGVLTLNRDVATLNANDGTVIINSTTCSPATVNLRGATLVLKTSGTITTLNAFSGTIDASELADDLTITTANLHPGVTIIKPKSGASLNYGTRNNIGNGPSES